MALGARDERKRVIRKLGEEIRLDLLLGETASAAELRQLPQGKLLRPINEINPGQLPLRDARGK